MEELISNRHLIIKLLRCICFQCFGAAGWVRGRASCL